MESYISIPITGVVYTLEWNIDLVEKRKLHTIWNPSGLRRYSDNGIKHIIYKIMSVKKRHVKYLNDCVGTSVYFHFNRTISKKTSCVYKPCFAKR